MGCSSPILTVRRPVPAAPGVPTVALDLPDQTEATRRQVLAQLDIVLDQLEQSTLRGEGRPPGPALEALRALGLADADDCCLAELTDLVLHAQWQLLRSGDDPSIEERQALVREARAGARKASRQFALDGQL